MKEVFLNLLSNRFGFLVLSCVVALYLSGWVYGWVGEEKVKNKKTFKALIATTNARQAGQVAGQLLWILNGAFAMKQKFVRIIVQAQQICPECEKKTRISKEPGTEGRDETKKENP